MSADPLDHRKETGPGGVQGLHNRHGFPQEVFTQVLGHLNGVLSGHLGSTRSVWRCFLQVGQLHDLEVKTICQEWTYVLYCYVNTSIDVDHYRHYHDD
jgi:hypothetical protein